MGTVVGSVQLQGADLWDRCDEFCYRNISGNSYTFTLLYNTQMYHTLSGESVYDWYTVIMVIKD